MLTVLAVLGVLVVIFLAAVFATREDQALVPEEGDRADVALPERPLRASDIEQVRFGVTVRGYRMSEVDDVLARLAAELADRDSRIQELSAEAESLDLAAQPSAIGASSMLTAPTETDVPVPPEHQPAAFVEEGGTAAPEDGPSTRHEVYFPDVVPADPAGDADRTDRD